MKRTEDSLRDLWDTIKNLCIRIPLYSNYRGPRRWEKERVWENFWRDYSWKFPQHGKGNNQSSPGGTKSPIQDKSKEKHAKTYTNQINKDKHKEKILKASREKQQVTYKGNPIHLTADLLAELCRPEGNGRI